MSLLSPDDKEYIPLNDCGVKIIQIFRQNHQPTLELIKLLQTEIGVAHDWNGLYGLLEKSIKHNKLLGMDVYKVRQSLYLQYAHIITIPKCHFVKAFMEYDSPLAFFVTNMPNPSHIKNINLRGNLKGFRSLTAQTIYNITKDKRALTEFGCMNEFGGDWIPFDYQDNPISLKIVI